MSAAPENADWEDGARGLPPSPTLHVQPPAAQAMAESAPNAELLSSLGRLVRGLSALFWGLPVALVVCVQTAKGEWFEKFNVVPPIVVTAVLFYGLGLLGHFQAQERVWRAALDRAKILSLLNLGLSPFLYWWSRMPSQPFFNSMVHLMMFSGLLFLFALNPLLWRLAAMLPDETLRLETKLFTAINRYLIALTFALLLTYFVLMRAEQLPSILIQLQAVLEKTGLLLALFLVLLPVAMTMALIWKAKETIFNSIFGAEQ
jgi:hypothetical protein